MNEKGICEKHGEFTLAEGCTQCLVERRGEAQEDLLDKISDLPLVTEVELKPPEPVPTAIVKVKPEQDALVQSFYNQAVGLLDYAEKAVVATKEDYKGRANDLTVIRKLRKAIEEKRWEYTRPINEHLDAINAAFKTFAAPLVQADSITTKTMLDYRIKQDSIRKEQERINQMRLDAANAEMELKGELSESVGLVEVAPVAQKTIRTDLGSAGMTDSWKYEVVDFGALPDEYKVVDTAMLNSIAKKHHDQKQIPGVRFYNEPYMRTR